jgi:hypothetical protein
MKRNYLNIEKSIYKSVGKIGYIIIFTCVFSLLMVLVDFILHCFVDNHYTSKFLFSGEISFSKWINLMWKNYSFSSFKTVFFAFIFIILSMYRSKALTDEFSK